LKGFIKYLLLLVISTNAISQQYVTKFGQNRIQYKSFDWYYYSTNNFDVYYTPGGKEYAIEAINYLEEEFLTLTDRLGYLPNAKTKIFVYNSIHDLQQSNIGIGGDVYTIGGLTDFVKLEIEVAYPGQSNQFKEDLIYQVGKTLINDMMYGGSLGEIFQNSYLLTLPQWFIDGAAKYMAFGWSQEMDDFVRDFMSKKKIKKLNQIDEKSAGILGQSVWNYIAVKYGDSNISNILNLTRIIRKEENSIANTLGISFKNLIENWKEYYLNQKIEVDENYVSPNAEYSLGKIPKSKNLIKSTVSFNNNMDKVAYATIKQGRYEIYVKDLNTGKKKKIESGGFNINGQEIDFQLPLLDWQDSYTIGAIIYKRGFLYLNTYNLETGKKRQKPLNRFRQIESFSFNDNGRLLVISGDIDGQNDIYLMAMNRNSVRRVTHDIYDDLDPVFVPGTAAIVFSSNRLNDSIRVKNIPIESIDQNFNLFVYDLDTTTNFFYRVTNQNSSNIKPHPRNENEIYYLSNQNGIFNLYKYMVRDSLYTQLTNFDRSISSYDINFDPETLVFSTLYKGKDKLFLYKNLDFSENKFTPETARIQRKKALRVVNRIIKNKEIKIEEDTTDLVVPLDEGDPDSFLFEEEDLEENPEWLDTDNYEFEDEPTGVIDNESFFSKYFSFEQENERIGPIPYAPRFSFNSVITSFLWDPYRNFMIFTESEINDILENYKLKGGALLKQNFREGDLFAEFDYLKYWLDFKLRYDIKTYFIDDRNVDTELLQKYKMNRLQFTAALPITHSFRIEASPIFTNTSFTNLNFRSIIGVPNDFADNSQEQYFGGNVAMVFDNKIEEGFNLYHGTVAKLEYTSQFHSNDNSMNFSNLKLDVRHYQKIHKEITWASKLFYGKQMGPSAKKYMLGGMDNWLFADRADHGTDLNNPLRIDNNFNNSDIFFNEFVTNLRGLDFNEAYGTDALVFNTELRLPLFRYLSNGPIKSNFLRNFQIISFVDIGSVWTGSPPFSSGRTISRSFRQGSFRAEIVKFQNPWLGGFGYGFRTVFLGYYIKVDAARPYIDGETGNYRFYFTLGLDF